MFLPQEFAPSSGAQRLELGIDDGVARITLNRAEAANAIDLTFAREFEAAATTMSRGATRVVLITAAGRNFCVGGDLKGFAGEADLGAHLDEVTRHLHEGIARMVEMDAPVVAAVNGAVAGAGLGIVCAADIVVAGESSTFLMAYTRLGLTPDGSSSWFLAQHVGLHRALDLALTNRVLNAREALEWGIVSRVVPDDTVLSEAQSIVAILAAGPTAAYGAAARLVRSARGCTLRQHLDEERTQMAERARGVDGREGVAAFVDRRDATFTGE
ncbi:MAG: enoyl-CoA hydratase/isomerase family protein [Acidimicrobiales bacterium]